MAKIIECTCEECRYNEDHVCHAANIEVRSSGDKEVHSSAGTCCSTFESKSDNCGCNTNESKNDTCGCRNR